MSLDKKILLIDDDPDFNMIVRKYLEKQGFTVDSAFNGNQGLEKVYQEPEAFRRCFKTFGNGGLFSFSGYFRSKKLGTFRCWVTDKTKSVVLEVKGKKLVISPHSPESFISALECEKSR